jgi:hypothetical protein
MTVILNGINPLVKPGSPPGVIKKILPATAGLISVAVFARRLYQDKNAVHPGV